ncbi:stage II sporulation protein E [Actinophytocola oryzae]|uniref:Stage II sporulation protein E n=1 Tax=Actinophytocola oryzae TaxID=502181 RepID=A0A4R7V7L7_9PSEU|nr:stage II sporulation protein E [Actinophytocola oryzae]
MEKWHRAFGQVLHRAHLASAGDLADIVNNAAAPVGVSVQVYLADMSQGRLCPVQSGPALLVDSTTAGEAFQRTEIVPVDAVGSTPPYLWIPLLNGTERLGVARVDLPPDADPHDTWLREQCWALVGLTAHLVMSKQHYSDLFHTVRRSEPLSVASELLRQLLPPQTFACDQLVVSALMEPSSRVAGDGYDYAIDAGRAYLGIFDAMGHDMNAGLITSVALAATRNARRNGFSASKGVELADEAIREVVAPKGFVPFATALIAELDLDTGVLRYLNAGHPPAVLLRAGKVVGHLDRRCGMPLGLGHLGHPRGGPVTVRLQPGDKVLFYTDGVTEARSTDGEMFGLDQLIHLIELHERAGLPTPETLRRITRAVMHHQNGHLSDDATLLLVEWDASAPNALLPEL